MIIKISSIQFEIGVLLGVLFSITTENPTNNQLWKPWQFCVDNFSVCSEWPFCGLHFALRFNDQESRSVSDIPLLHCLSQRSRTFGHFLSDPIYFVFHSDQEVPWTVPYGPSLGIWMLGYSTTSVGWIFGTLCLGTSDNPSQCLRIKKIWMQNFWKEKRHKNLRRAFPKRYT